MSDDWRVKLAAKLLGDGVATRPSDFAPTGATALEIAFGQARSEVTYVLELARAHGVPAVGNVIGDEVWVKLGTSTLRFHMDRGQRQIRASVPGREGDAVITWDDGLRSLARSGEALDMKTFVREAIDATVGGFKSSPPQATAATARELPAARSDAPPASQDGKAK